VAGVASSKLKLSDGVAPDGPGRTVVGEFRSGPIHERIAGRAWPAAQSHVVTLELRD
jgi:hypothetical protein